MCAVIKRGILGGFQNKIANVVGSSWKGIATMRSLPISVANPQTALQTAQRDSFGGVAKMASSLLTTIVKPLWDRFAQQESGYNAFIRTNIARWDAGNFNEPEQLKISVGTLAVSEILTAVADVSAKTLVVTWDTDPEGDSFPTDQAYIAIHNGSIPNGMGFAAVADRSAGTVTIPNVPVEYVGVGFNTYLAFRKADGTKVSNTAYMMSTAVA